MAEKKISYTTRDFQGIRTELINFTRTYYPDLIQNFNDAGIFSVLLDLNAAVTDNLQFQIDRSIQETVLQYAQQKASSVPYTALGTASSNSDEQIACKSKDSGSNSSGRILPAQAVINSYTLPVKKKARENETTLSDSFVFF